MDGTAPGPNGPPHSPVLARASAPASAVGRRDRPWGLLFGLGGVAALGLFVFTGLSHARQARVETPSVPAPAAAPARLPPATATFTPASALPAAEPAPAPAQLAAAPVAPQPDLASRLKAPAMVVDLGEPSPPPSVTATLPTVIAPAGQISAARPATSAAAQASAEERFAEKVAGATTETAHASRLSDVALVAPQGTVIPAVLETAINSDLPGFVRALVTRDVRGFDGSTVLIPRGSKLIGQYRSGVATGQSRAFVVWSRLLTPEGISIDIGSPGTDPLGRGGLQGETNTHFLRRFGGSILLSVLSAGLEAVVGANTRSNNTAIVIGSPQQAANVAAIALQKDIDVPPTITVPQGAPIRVFVARDLDFSTVMTRKP